MEYMLHWWGGCTPIIKEKYEYEEYMYFKSKEDRQEVINNLLKFDKYGLVIDKKEGELTHKDTIAKVTCLYNGKEYKFEYNFGKEYPEESASFMFFDGNYSCDCNKSLFIQRYCDESFPELLCGDNIMIVDFKIEYR